MKFLQLATHEPAFNLAVEETFLDTLEAGEPGWFLLWQNFPSVIIGRHQCAHDEIDADALEASRLPLCRRITGGGAVFHDLGNINFSFIENVGDSVGAGFAEYNARICRALASLGVKASMTGRNDLEVCGKKVSGSAQIRRKGKILHHGTLLVQVNFELMGKVLTPGQRKTARHAVASAGARVANLEDYWSPGTDMRRLCHVLLEHCADTAGHLSPHIVKAAEELARSKYHNQDWNWGKNMQPCLEQAGSFAWGEVRVRMRIADGILHFCQFTGDFFSRKDIGELENALVGSTIAALPDLLKKLRPEQWFMGCKYPQITSLLLKTAANA